MNQRLEFDRAAAAGFRLDLEAGSSERWAPGESRTVTLVRFGGAGGTGSGGSDRRHGSVSRLSPPSIARASGRRPATASGSATRTCGSGSRRIARRSATSRSGATRRTSGSGWPSRARSGPSELDAVVVGAVVVDPLIGVVKADIGIKDGRIVGRRAGRATRGSATASTCGSGPHTAPISGYGLIATPGAVDSHVHFDQPEPHPGGALRRRHDPDQRRLHEPPAGWSGRCAGLEGFPVNVGLQANARSTDPAALEVAARRRRGRVQDPRGLRRLPGAHRRDPAVRRRARRLGEPPHGRPARERGARGHRRGDRGPDRPRVPRRGHRAAATSRTSSGIVREANVICSSTTPTIPWGVSAVDEGVPMTDPQPRRDVRGRRGRRSSSASARIPRRWPPRARSTSLARSRS